MFILLMIANLAQAMPTSLVAFYPNEVLRNEIVTFKPLKGHHFSAEAPQNCGTGSVAERTPREISCLFSQAGLTQANLNVCDDSKTFCRPQQLSVNVVQGQDAPPTMLKRNESLNKEMKHKLTPGFAEGSVSELSSKAAGEKQPVLVMISTDWCPSCNEAKEYLLTSQAFLHATRDWFKIYVDGDSLAARDWNQVVPFHYFPSFVLLNSRMEEIGRYTGELRQSEFEAWAKEQEGYLDDPIAQLKTRVLERRAGGWLRWGRDLINGVSAKQRDAQESRLMKYALDMEDRDLIAKLLEKNLFPGQREEVLKFKISELERMEREKAQDLKMDKIKLLKEMLGVTFTKEHWSQYLADLCELDATACKPFVDQIPERISFLSKQTGLIEAEKESQMADETYFITQIYQSLNDKEDAKKYARDCSEHFEVMSKNSQLKISRAASQGMIACLELAGDFEREERAVDALIEAYPTEPTFLLRKARMLRKEKKSDEALEMLTKAEALAFGYNWYTLQLLRGELYLDLKKPDQTRQVVETTLAQVRLDSSQDKRNQSLVERLRGLQARASE